MKYHKTEEKGNIFKGAFSIHQPRYFISVNISEFRHVQYPFIIETRGIVPTSRQPATFRPSRTEKLYIAQYIIAFSLSTVKENENATIYLLNVDVDSIWTKFSTIWPSQNEASAKHFDIDTTYHIHPYDMCMYIHTYTYI